MKSVDQSSLAKEFEVLTNSYIHRHGDRLEPSLTSLISIVWVYFYYRRSRPTQVDQINLPADAEIPSVALEAAAIISIFPACDYICVDESFVYGSRFFKKCANDLPQQSFDQLHQVVRDHTGRAIHLKKPKRDFTILVKSYVSLFRFVQSSPMALWALLRHVRFILFISRRPQLGFLRSLISATINYYSNFLHFSALLKKHNNVEAILLSNFYSPENLGAVRAANKIGVPTFDLQHGVQKNVYAYEEIESLSPELRPTKLILWPSRGTSRPNFLHEKRGLDDREMKKCLVSLQPSNSESFLLDIIKLVDKGYSVTVRPHPRRNAPAYIAQLENIFSGKIFISRNEFIEDDFKICNLHISEYSSSLIESANLGIVSVAVHETALSYMGKEIEKGDVLYFHGMEKFLRSSRF